MNGSRALGMVAALAALPSLALADDKADCAASSEKAQQLRDDRKLIEARAQFLSCAREVCPAVVRKDCADQVADVDRRMPSIVLHVKDKTGQDIMAVKVTSDGAPFADQLDGRSLSIDPGTHTLRFEAPGNEPLEQKLLVSEGEHNRLVTATFGKPDVVVPTTPKAKGPPVGAIILGAVGLVGMGVGTAFYIVGLNQKGTDETGCKLSPTGCSTSEVNDIHTKLVVGDIAFIGGAALVGGAIIWAIVHYATGTTSKEGAPAAFELMPTFGGARATLRF